MIVSVLDPVSGEALRLAASLVFATAAIGKFRNPSAFRQILDGYRLLPERTIRSAARALPVVELAVAVSLPFGMFMPILAAVALLLLFAAAMAVNLLRGRKDIDCGCNFAARKSGLRWPAIGVNIALACALLCAPADTTLTLPQAVTAVLAGVAVFLLIQAGNALIALGPVAPPFAGTRL